MNPIVAQISSYAAIIALIFVLLNIQMRGFLLAFLRVRTSKDKLVMVRAWKVNERTHSTGRIEEGFLVYKSNKEKKRIALKNKQGKERDGFYRALGINWIDVDEETNAIIQNSIDLRGVEGYDAIKNEHLHTRALYRPALTSTQDKILILIAIGALVAAGIGAWLSFQGLGYEKETLEIVKGLGEQIKTISQNSIKVGI